MREIKAEAGRLARLSARAVKTSLAVLAALHFALAPAADAKPVQGFEQPELTDPIARLQTAIDSGRVHLDFTQPRGYLDSLLDALDVPSASQSLVFSKTSFQAPLISPDAPRALYFNDDVYVGFVRDGPVLEFASVDPRYGTVFYTLEQAESGRPQFEREGARCINCHLPTRSEVPIPRLMMMSVMPSDDGTPMGPLVMLTTDRSPMVSRWGGWFITGTGGTAAHMGNMALRSSSQQIPENYTDLADGFDTSRYLTARSDVVALMLLAHQSEVHNLIGEAAYAVRALVGDGPVPTSDMSPRTIERIGEAVDPLVRAMLFVDAVPFGGLNADASTFAEEFQSRGPRDRQGRSLRDLDLDTRLLRYPLSYLVYSDAFDQLPVLARDHAYERFLEVFEMRDQGAEFSHLTEADRTALMEILLDTKPSFREWVESR